MTENEQDLAKYQAFCLAAYQRIFILEGEIAKIEVEIASLPSIQEAVEARESLQSSNTFLKAFDLSLLMLKFQEQRDNLVKKLEIPQWTRYTQS